MIVICSAWCAIPFSRLNTVPRQYLALLCLSAHGGCGYGMVDEQQAGFEVSAIEQFHLDPRTTTEFLEVYKVHAMTSPIHSCLR